MTAPLTPKVIDVPAGRQTQFVALVRGAARLEVEDAFFNTASAVVLPDTPGAAVNGGAILTPFTNIPLLAELTRAHQEFTVGIVTKPFEPDAPGGDTPPRETGLHVIIAALRFLEKNPSHVLLIAGHTDRAGDDAFNQRLSDARGRSVLALLEGKKADFVAACHQFHAPDDDPAVLHFAARTRGFDCEPASTTHATPAEIRRFQRDFNAAFAGRFPKVAESGVANDETRGAYFDLYEDELEQTAGGKDALRTLRGQLRFVDASHKVLGFGERFPRENPQQDGLRSQQNRRVELLFFAPPRVPDVKAKDAGEQLFRKKLFTFAPLDRDTLALAPQTTAPAGTTAFAITETDPPPKDVVDDVLTTSMRAAGVFDPNDAWAFLRPFDELHPDEGLVPRRKNSVPQPLPPGTKKKPRPTPPPNPPNV